MRPDAGHVEGALRALTDLRFPGWGYYAGSNIGMGQDTSAWEDTCSSSHQDDISGVGWQHAWDSRQSGDYGGIPVFFIGRAALLANKRAAGRAKDLADVEALESR